MDDTALILDLYDDQPLGSPAPRWPQAILQPRVSDKLLDDEASYDQLQRLLATGGDVP
jgi:hypothetical protein